ncbi:MAG: hypothetical protein ACSLEN_14555 [Candidatus Malihini olakiniferum]
MDERHDFYTPQSFVAADGRRLLFGWMDVWGSDMPTQTMAGPDVSPFHVS